MPSIPSLSCRGRTSREAGSPGPSRDALPSLCPSPRPSLLGCSWPVARWPRLAAAVAVALALGAHTASAQGGHFTAGDLFIDSSSIQNMAGGSAIVRVDPLSHASTIFLDTTDTQAAGVFDPYRQRIIFRGAVGVAFPATSWMADGNGVLQILGPIDTYSSFAPTGDGRIYAVNGNSACCEPFAWIDAANVAHVLMDTSGLHPFLMDGVGNYTVSGMVYDPITNSLFMISPTPCGGGPFSRPYVRKVPLSADGTHVTGPAGCASFDVTGSLFGDLAGAKSLSRLPDGRLLIAVDTTGGTPQTTNLPRLLQIDPVSFTITPFAFTGNYISAHVIDGGTWSHVLNRVVVVDTGVDNLRSFAEGTAGPGSAIVPIGTPVSTAGGSAELVRIFDIPSSACRGAWIPYGKGLAGKGAIVPTLMGGGCAQAGSIGSLAIAGAVGGASGVLFVGLGPAAVPFKGGTLHVASLALTASLVLGGTPGTAGAGAVSLPVVLPAGLSGFSLFLQAAFHDAAAVKHVSLTQGVQMEIG